MSNIINVNQDQFIEEVIEKSKTVPVVVDFWAPWCDHVSNMGKKLLAAMKNYSNEDQC